mmetsp:Transcript_6809/g.41551  ORF Transcript_6809/g.41551 Transcript_6809/m.41551 type:complete len:123 (+) Transcript_6809:1879-2247(+)
MKGDKKPSKTCKAKEGLGAELMHRVEGLHRRPPELHKLRSRRCSDTWPSKDQRRCRNPCKTSASKRQKKHWRSWKMESELVMGWRVGTGGPVVDPVAPNIMHGRQMDKRSKVPCQEDREEVV